MKRIIFWACLMVCVTIKATVTTSLKVEVDPAPCNKFCLHMLKIDQNFVFDKEDIKDTIKLSLASVNFSPAMHFEDRGEKIPIDSILADWADTKGDSLIITNSPIKVFVNGKQIEEYRSTQTSIYIPASKLKTANIHLQYVFCSLCKMIVVLDPKTQLCFDMFDGRGVVYVCHFKTPNMRWQDVCFVNRNKDELLWINKHNTQRNDSIFVDGNSNPENIEFFIINKKLNDNITYYTEQFSLNLFAPKHFDLEDKDKCTAYKCTATSIHTDDRINKHFDKTKNVLTKVAKFFPEDTIHRNITVQYGGFRNSGAAVYCNAPNDFMLIADTAKNFDRILFREICHMFMPFNSSKFEEAERDILVEGLNEYISRLVAYDTQEQVDSITTALFNKLSEKERSLKVLDSGYDTLKMDRYGVRTGRIPYFLNLFVHKIGKDKFMTLFKKFCDFARKNEGVATLSDFERIAKSCGVNDEQWKNLINNL